MRAVIVSFAILAAFLTYVGINSTRAVEHDQPCVVSILNRTAFVQPDGSWSIDNIPSNMGQVRARMTCVINGETISGQSDFFEIIPNVVTNLDAPIVLGEVEPIPESLDITTPTTTLTTSTLAAQLIVTATFPDSSQADVTLREAGTNYNTSNPSIATISDNGLVTAIASGAALILAANEEVIETVFFTVLLSDDSDADGLPDDYEIANGLNPNDPVDALEDGDVDGLSNLDEFLSGTEIDNADTDGDTILDGEEVEAGADGFITNPLLADTDGDKIRDALEISVGTDPTDVDDFDFSLVLADLSVTPAGVSLIVNSVISEATAQFVVTGTLIDGTEVDLTSKSTGTRYFSSDLLIVNFGITDGKIFAGQDGSATITISNGAFEEVIPVTVSTFIPTPLSRTNLPGTGFANAVFVDEDIAWIAHGSDGLLKVFLGNRQSPVIDTPSTVDTPGNAQDVIVVGDLAFIADGVSGLQIIDTTVPEIIGAVDTPANAWDVAVAGDFAYVADGDSGLQIVDVSDPTLPAIIGTIDTPGTAKGVDVNGDTVVVADGGTGAVIVDVSDRTTPAIISTLNIGGDARDVEIQNNTAYFAANSAGFRPVEFTDRENPVLGVEPLGGDILQDVAIASRFAFGADIVRPNGVPLYDVGDNLNPLLRDVMNFITLGDANGIGVDADENYVYLTAGPISENGTSGSTSLYIGQYVSLEDPFGIPPEVEITSPADGGAIFERGFARITANASDDVFVNSVTFSIDGVPVFTDFGEPFVFPFPVPEGSETFTFGALAVDLAGNATEADTVTVTVEEPTERIISSANYGIATAPLLPSANPGQVITLESDAPGVFDGSTQVTFPTINDSGVRATTTVGVGTIGPDGSTATVTVPSSAETGGVVITNVAAVPALQIVPRLTTFTNSDFRPGANLQLNGGGFIEGGSTIRFGAVSVIDPDTGTGTVNVFSTNSAMNVGIPAGAAGTVTVETVGGTSNNLVVGPGSFDAIASVAALGTPADPGIPSAIVGQQLEIIGTNLKTNANVLFPTVNDQGLAGSTGVRISNISQDGTTAQVTVPNSAVTGNVTMLGTTGAYPLQIVPRVTSHSLADFTYSVANRNLTLSGSGFAEGQTTVSFGDFDIVDPGTGSGTIDVFSSGTSLNVPVPSRPSGAVTVTTAGGTSDPRNVGPTSFTGFASTANYGTAADPGVPSANVGQVLTLTGSGFQASSNVWFPSIADDGTPSFARSRVGYINVDGTVAQVTVPNGAVSGLVTAPGTDPTLDPPADLDALTEVYSNDFEVEAGAEWSTQARTTTSGTDIAETSYLGQFSNSNVILTLTGLPAHERIVLEWDQFILDTWDGSNDRFGIIEKGTGTYVFDRSFPDNGQAAAIEFAPDITGEFGSGNTSNDRLYQDLVSVIPHSGDTLTLRFYGVGLQGVSDESWGIDNIRVLVDDTPVPTQTRFPLQIVPRITTFSNTTFSYSVQNRNIDITGSGFAEGETTVSFGDFEIEDPDTGTVNMDVYSSGTHLNVPVPSRPGGAVSVSTEGGTSAPFNIGPTSFTGLTSDANYGTPADGGIPSANVGQVVTVSGSGFRSNSVAWFPTLTDNGIPGFSSSPLSNINVDGTEARVTVPNGAISGLVTIPGTDQALETPADLSLLTEVYSNDFETAAGSEWSSQVRTTTTGTDIAETSYLGRFATADVILNLTGLPAHERIVIEWDQFIFDTWDGNNDRFGIIERGAGTYVYDRSFPNTNGAAAIERPADETGEFGTGNIALDRVWRDLSAVIPHDKDSLTLRFYGVGLSGVSDESWGIDNIRILVDGTPLVTETRFPLQVVPRITTFSNTDFRPSGTSRSLDLSGSGFIEGSSTVSYGAVDVVDPGTGTGTIDVYSTGTRMNSIIPASPGGLITVTTDGGTSNEFQIGPATFDGISATANHGTPASAVINSANTGQVISLFGSGFRTNTNVVFPTIDDSGTVSTTAVRMSYISTDGTFGQVTVPVNAKTGSVSIHGVAGQFTLQVVPRLTSFTNTDFTPSGTSRTLTLSGSGFTEGGTTVHYGSVDVVDPDTGFVTIDVFSSSSGMNSIIPGSPGGLVSVTTPGGTSNAIQVGPSAFTSIDSVAIEGTQAGVGASASPGQTVRVLGSGFRSNTSLLFPLINDSGTKSISGPINPSSISPDATEAWFVIPTNAETGNVTMPGTPAPIALDIVPRITSLAITTYAPGNSIIINGRGFIEGDVTISFGAVDIVDSGISTGINVDTTNSRMVVTIPAGAGDAITVTTSGGVSNTFDAQLPNVRLYAPPDGSTFSEDEVLVASAQARDSAGIDDLEFLVDNVLVNPTLTDVFARSVNGNSNIFRAGGNAGSGGGAVPPEVAFTATPGQRFVILDASGNITGSSSGCAYNPADGGQACGSGTIKSTDVASSGGIAGLVHGDGTMFLTGVFTDGTVPASPAPTRLTTTDFATETVISPDLNQVFFMGDGRTEAGIMQEFVVPAGATHLFLGFAETSTFNTGGTPSSYSDNAGSLLVGLALVDTSPATFTASAISSPVASTVVNGHLFMTPPAAPDTVDVAARATDTDANTADSSEFIFNVAAPTFTQVAVASFGTPVNPGEVSANPNQTIQLDASYRAFDSRTLVGFPTVNDSGVGSMQWRTVSYAAADGQSAWIVVPQTADTGTVEVLGVGTFELQVVPRLTSYSNISDFNAGAFIRLRGLGFIEGASTANFGSIDVVDPDVGTGTVNVHATNTGLDTTVPSLAGGGITVTTAGGTSNVLQVGPASFSGISSVASVGTPADPGTASANPSQVITITGTGLRTLTRMVFPTVGTDGTPGSTSALVSNVNSTGTEATVVVPLNVVTGDAFLFGAPETRAMQSVPRLYGNFTNADFRSGQNLSINGRGFVEGDMTVHFGSLDLVDPDNGSVTVDVFSNSTAANVTIPSNAGGLVSLTTDGGTSNAVQIGPSSFSSIVALATYGTPADPGIPSANGSQLISLTGSGFRNNTNVRFEAVDTSGVTTSSSARVNSVSLDGTTATVFVPQAAVTGPVSIYGAESNHDLQSVPRLFGSFTNSDFRAGQNIRLNGRGFVEGAVTISFGAADQVDPNTGTTTVDVFSTNTAMNVIIPSGAGGLVSVNTAGGTSNAVQLGAESFTGIIGTASVGTPADPGIPSANTGQLVTITGTGLRTNSNVRFPTVNDSGVPSSSVVRVSRVINDGTEAVIAVPLGAVTGPITVEVAPESADLQSVPRLFGGFTNSNFVPGQNLRINGRGFVEGQMDVHFGDLTLADPDEGSTTVDVFSTGTATNITIPSGAGGLVWLTTSGGESNAVQIGPASFTALVASANHGTPSDGTTPSANPGQLITVEGSGFRSNTNIQFQRIDQSGIPSLVNAQLSSVNLDGTSGTLVVPLETANGQVIALGAPEVQDFLSVPRITGNNAFTFGEGNNLRLNGRGFIEGESAVTFGSAEVIDPSTDATTINVFSSNTAMNVTIPAGAEPSVVVTTPGGDSNEHELISDNLEQPPTVSIAAPFNGDTVFEGGAFPVTVNASDDVFLKTVTLQVLDPFFDEIVSFERAVGPFEFLYIVPPGSPSQIVLRASAEDLGGNVSVSDDVILNVVASPISITATATDGTPADASLPSALAGQTITVDAPAATFNPASTVRFPIVSDSGVPGILDVTVNSASAGGDSATVIVPGQAETGGVSVPGALGNAALQVVPRITSFSNSSFRASVNLRLDGSGFIEGESTINFGSTPVVDPNNGSSIVNVFSSNAAMHVTIPAAPGSSVSVTTAGGTSAPVLVGPTSLTGVTALANVGTAASGGIPSANVGQAITISGTDLAANTTVLFPTRNDSGAIGSTAITVSSAAGDGLSAQVTVPNNAVTAAISLPGATGTADLQVVPRINSFSNADFRPSGTGRNLSLFGSGFVEGGITVSFGATDVVDPSISSGTIDVYSSGTGLNSIIPGTPGANVSVTTAGGTSNTIFPGPTSFTGITSVANYGTPANGGSASANVGQLITVAGAGFKTNTNLIFQTLDDSGLDRTSAIRVSSVNLDGTEATVVVPNSSVTGTLTMPGNSGNVDLQVVPRLTSYSNADFRPSGTSRSMQLFGSGMKEGAMTVNYGSVPVVDPSVSSGTLDVFSAGTSLTVVIPSGAESSVTLVTDGGTSNVLQVGPSAFGGFTSVANFGTPTNGLIDSANISQGLTLNGVSLTTNTNVRFETADDQGLIGSSYVRVSNVNPAGTEALVNVPVTAVTGSVTLFGTSGTDALQVVPRITNFTNADFRPSGSSRNMDLTGSGFVEGDITVHFGAVDVIDPNIGTATIDVYGSGTRMNSVIPSSAGGLLSVTTPGGTSNEFQVGPNSFTGITAVANHGTPSDAGVPSANVGQVLTLDGSGFRTNTNVRFSFRDDSGILRATSARVNFVSADATTAQVSVPTGAVTGPISVYGLPGTFELQVVPRITGFTNADFSPSGSNRNLDLNGSGFEEGESTVNFGAVSVVDPSTNTSTIDVYSTGTRMNSIIPSAPGGLVTVTNTGGTSNALQIGPATFTAITTEASRGTAAASGASANPGQVIHVTGSGFRTNTSLRFPTRNSSGVLGISGPVNPNSISPDGTEAYFTVPSTTRTGLVEMPGTGTLINLQIVPRIDSLSFSTFVPGNNISLTGAGFTNGDLTVNFDGVDVVDSGINTGLTVNSTNTAINNFAIPTGAGSAITVTTVGGTSNVFDAILPNVRMTSPADGTTISEDGVLVASAQARDTSGIDDVEFIVDGSPAVPTLTDAFALSVSGKANLFRAGGNSGVGGGVLPPGTAISAAPGQRIVVLGTAGSVSGWANGCSYNEADGGQVCGSGSPKTTNVASSGDIAGLIHGDGTMFLAGVFMDSVTPVTPSPDRLTTTDFNTQTEISPGLNQTFFIGDGRTDTGVMQEIVVPPNATHLYLGFIETSNFNTGGAPSSYNDNGGSILAGIALVNSAPATFTASAISSATGSTIVNGHLFTTVAAAPDTVTVAARATDTDTNTADSAAFTYNIVAPLVHPVTVASFGTPANGSLPSANANQVIELSSTYSVFNSRTSVRFPTINDSGTVGTTHRAPTYVSPDGQSAWVAVPQNAETGTVDVVGLTSFDLQIVPRITSFSNNSNFSPGQFLRLNGLGFIEGGSTVSLGATDLIDPDTATGTINVSSTNSRLDLTIPASPGGMVTVTTAGGTSNAVAVGPTSFTGIVATATYGTAADPGTPSANNGQTITVTGTGLRNSTQVVFETISTAGIPGFTSALLFDVLNDGTEGLVTVPSTVVTGSISLTGAPEVLTLQSVPRLFSNFTNADFRQGSPITLNGRGFVEGGTTIQFGAASIVDPDTSSSVVDVYSSGNAMNLSIPGDPGGLVSIETAGGVSNAVQIGPSSFTGVTGISTHGTAADGGSPSANPGQKIVITGSGFRSNTNVTFPIVNDSGIPGITNARISSLNLAGTEASVVVPLNAVTGQVTVPGIQSTIDPPSDLTGLAEVYSNDFEVSAGAEWSSSTRTTTTGTDIAETTYLGRFSNNSVFLTLNGLPAHNSLVVEWDQFILDTWDGSGAFGGPDSVGILSSGSGVVEWQRSFPQDAGSLSIDVAPDVEGEFGPIATSNDRLYEDLTAAAVHSGETAVLVFFGTGLQGLNDESWGLDNLRVLVNTDPLPALSRFDLQIVPRLFGNFTNSDFAPGQNLRLNGRGFVEGGVTINFGSTDVVDPDTGATTVNVFTTSTAMNVTIPNSPGGLISITTAGGTSNAVQIGPVELVDIDALANFGTPADAGQLSANTGQTISLTGSGFRSNTNVLFQSVNTSGVAGTVRARVSSVNADRTQATVVVPSAAVTGSVTVIGGTGSIELQIVPRLTSFSGSLTTNSNLRLNGSGFVEGGITVDFDGISVVDPDTSSTTVDVFGSNSSVNVTVPSGAGTPVAVTTDGGTSNEISVP